MNRVAHLFTDVEGLLDGLRPKRPIETLLVHWLGLIDLLQRHLSELNEHRRLVAGTPAELETLERIKYWEEVLVWMKQQAGSDVLIMERME
jgi:hypothetical protein